MPLTPLETEKVMQGVLTKAAESSVIMRLAKTHQIANTRATFTLQGASSNEFVETDFTDGSIAFTKKEIAPKTLGLVIRVPRASVDDAAFSLTDYIQGELVKGLAKTVDKMFLNPATTNPVIAAADTLKPKADKIAVPTTGAKLDEELEKALSALEAGGNPTHWVLNKALKTRLRQLKDGNGRHLYIDGMTDAAGSTLFGLPVVWADSSLFAAKHLGNIVDASAINVVVSRGLEIEQIKDLSTFRSQHVAIGANVRLSGAVFTANAKSNIAIVDA